MRGIILFVMAALLAGCAGAPPVPTATVMPTALPPTNTPQPTETVQPTNTPQPTDTSQPTDTRQPTKTPTPLPTFTPTPQPIKLTGSGDSVVDILKDDWVGIAKIKYSGGSNFAIWTYGQDGKRIDLIVNTIGAYNGIRPIDFLDNQQTSRLEIKASGKWEIEIVPVMEARWITVPGVIEGKGDDVVILSGKPDLGKVDASKAMSNFAIWAYGGNRRNLAVNEIAPYKGTIILTDAFILDIKATGAWSIDVTGK